VTPELAVSTADAYRWLDEDRARMEDAAAGAPGALDPRVAATLDLAGLSTWDGVSRIAGNDFEPVVAARHPTLSGDLEEMRRLGPAFAMMTGSGSTLFAVFESPLGIGRLSEEHHRRVTTTKTSIDVVQPVREG
jgi:4-diphosphocytidyl-2C-methyl-D-erythritol kinase